MAGRFQPLTWQAHHTRSGSPRACEYTAVGTGGIYTLRWSGSAVGGVWLCGLDVAGVGAIALGAMPHLATAKRACEHERNYGHWPAPSPRACCVNWRPR